MERQVHCLVILAETVSKERGGEMNLCFSPVPELALFFGMTSAETDEVQVGFRRRGQDRGVALLCCSVVISLQSTSFTELCICPLPYMVFTWDWGALVGVSKIYMVVEVLHGSWLADNQSHKDWKWCVSSQFKNMTWTSGRGSNNGKEPEIFLGVTKHVWKDTPMYLLLEAINWPLPWIN